jgi:hypothetical protein
LDDQPRVDPCREELAVDVLDAGEELNLRMPPFRAVELPLESPAATRSVAPRPSMRIESTNRYRIDDSRRRPEMHGP